MKSGLAAGACFLLCGLGLFLTIPRATLGQATTLIVCIIQNPGDTCTADNGYGTGSGNNGGNTEGGGAGAGAGAGGGGGGGGGGNTTPIAYSPTAGDASFSGYAYPGSVVTLLSDAAIVAQTTADSDAHFAFQRSNLAPGAYTYSLWSVDSNNIRSLTYSFTFVVAPGVGTIVSGIVLPPTVALDKSEVKQGDPITLSGMTAPNAVVDIVLHSAAALSARTIASSAGIWNYVFDTSALELGSHAATVHSTLAAGASPQSSPVNFTVGDTNVAATQAAQTCNTKKGDLNCDGRVNLVDFSIMAYWYGRTLGTKGAFADITGDGVVDLRDFSILAFYWTG